MMGDFEQLQKDAAELHLANELMRTVRYDGSLTTPSLVAQLMLAAKGADSSLHEAAALRLQTLDDAVRRRQEDIDGLLAILRAAVATCPWEFDAGGSPAFWHNMRLAQSLVERARKECGL